MTVGLLSPFSSITEHILTFRCNVDAEKKKQKLRVKWQDHFGGVLTLNKVIDSDGEETKVDELAADGEVSWSDRKKRDRLREKELLSTVKYVVTTPRLLFRYYLLTSRTLL